MGPITARSRRSGAAARARKPVGGWDVQQLLTRLRAQISSPGYKPPMLPAVALQVHALSRRHDATPQSILPVLERDPMLAADVLRRASGADMAGRHPPKSLRDAAMRLGTRGLGAFVLEVALNGRIFRVPGLEEPMRELQRHSTVVAAAARAVAQHAGVDDPDAAELAGLLHDVGVAAGLHVLGGVVGNGPVPSEILAQMVLGYGAEASEIVASSWTLPPEIASAVSHHADPIFAVKRPDGSASESWDVVGACVALAHPIAMEVSPPTSPFAAALCHVSEQGLAHACLVLGCDGEEVATLRERVAQIPIRTL